MFQHSKCSKMVPLWYENHILASCWPSKIVSKSMPKRFENQLYLGYPLGTPKNTVFDIKTSPRWTPQISDFFKKSSKNPSSGGLGPNLPLRGLQEASKTLPRASKSHPRASQEAPKSPQEAPDSGLTWEPPELKVPGVRCLVSSMRCQVPGVRCQALA